MEELLAESKIEQLKEGSVITGTVMEEDCDGLCWQYIINELNIKPEFVVITEPTSLNIYRGQRGRMEIKVETTGISCHGSAPERGENAIYKMKMPKCQTTKRWKYKSIKY